MEALRVSPPDSRPRDNEKPEELAMSANLISLATQFLTPDVIAKMAQACGISDRTTAQKAVGAAVPALFTGLANLASKPDGARQLADAVASQPPSLSESLASMGDGSRQFADAGKSALGSLFGGSTIGALASTLGRYAGVGEGSARSLLSMLTPALLGILGREAGSKASALTQLLGSQKDSFAAAMPAGLSDLLKTNAAFNPAAAVAPAASRVNETYRNARERSDSMARAASPPVSEPSSRWLYWALPLLALLGLTWYLFSGDRTTEPVAQTPSQTRVAQGPPAVGDLQTQIASLTESLNGTLQGVRDWSSTRDVLPRLQHSAGELDRLTALTNRLPADARERLAGTIRTATAQLKAALDNVDATPGVAPDARPVLQALRARLDALAMTHGSVTQQGVGAIGDRVVYFARSPNDAVWISTYFDRDVHNSSGERIGVIHDLVMGPDGRVTAAVVGVGGFLGIGEKEVAVPFSAMQIARRDNDWHLVLDTTKDALKDAPPYEDAGNRVRLGPTKR
jgi:hypothetical protein